MNSREQRAVNLVRYFNAAIIFFIAVFFFLGPAGILISNLLDANLRQPGVPRAAWRLHRTLSPRFERWARARAESGRATQLSTENISGTEWPLFGTIFYLWGTEALQDAWEKNHAPGSVAPNVYARGAIDAAAKLVVDPKQASWVNIHWGTNYLKTENVFYRMLVIAGLTSHARLTGDKQYLPFLRDQVESYAAELDASKHGLMDDYPGECYPGDVLTSVAMVRRADRVLGTDHSAFVERALRGFSGDALDPKGLVSYMADAGSGRSFDWSRGCSCSYVSLFAPELWPEQARQWYDLYAENFWQEVWTAAGFREFPGDTTVSDWYFDVDSGPVVKGYGFAACAFGTGAARANGHFEHAYPLAAETLAISWVLPNGTYLFPRALSDVADAPYLGEAAILFNLTCQPARGVTVKTGGSLPTFVLIILAIQIGIGSLLVLGLTRSVRSWRRNRASLTFSFTRQQIAIWAGLMIAVIVLWLVGKLLPAFLSLLIAQLLPRPGRIKSPPQAT